MGKTGIISGWTRLLDAFRSSGPRESYRSASFLNPEKGKANTVAVRRGLSGETGTDLIIDYNGNYVYSAYAPIKYGEHTWSILVEIDLAEAMNPTLQSGEEYFAQFVEQNNYYDLFLISPDGFVFTLLPENLTLELTY